MPGHSPFEPFVLVLSAALLAWQVRELLLALASRHWPQVTGTVLKAWFDESVDRDDGREVVTHTANVVYRYRVGVRDYESARLSYQPTSGTVFGDVTALLRNVHAGREVDVYYDPRRPARAVLVPGSSTDNLLRVFAFAAFFGFMAWRQFGT
jgi:hypothetical protein